MGTCDAEKSHAILCKVNFNMFNVLFPILEYLSHSFPDFQMICSIRMGIKFHGICSTKFSVKDRQQWLGREFRCSLSLDMDKLFPKAIMCVLLDSH